MDGQEKRYYKMKNAGRCTECGNRDAETEAGRIRCGACKEKINTRRKARTMYLLTRYRCTRCGEADERTAAGYSCCEVCNAKARRYYESRRAKENGKL